MIRLVISTPSGVSTNIDVSVAGLSHLSCSATIRRAVYALRTEHADLRRLSVNIGGRAYCSLHLVDNNPGSSLFAELLDADLSAKWREKQGDSGSAQGGADDDDDDVEHLRQREICIGRWLLAAGLVSDCIPTDDALLSATRSSKRLLPVAVRTCGDPLWLWHQRNVADRSLGSSAAFSELQGAPSHELHFQLVGRPLAPSDLSLRFIDKRSHSGSDGLLPWCRVGFLRLPPLPDDPSLWVNINMMPYRMDAVRESLPDDADVAAGRSAFSLSRWIPFLESLAADLDHPPPQERAGKIGFLTVHESEVVQEHATQRRGGLHVESPGFSLVEFLSEKIRRDGALTLTVPMPVDEAAAEEAPTGSSEKPDAGQGRADVDVEGSVTGTKAERQPQFYDLELREKDLPGGLLAALELRSEHYRRTVQRKPGERGRFRPRMAADEAGPLAASERGAGTDSCDQLFWGNGCDRTFCGGIYTATNVAHSSRFANCVVQNPQRCSSRNAAQILPTPAGEANAQWVLPQSPISYLGDCEHLREAIEAHNVRFLHTYSCAPDGRDVDPRAAKAEHPAPMQMRSLQKMEAEEARVIRELQYTKLNDNFVYWFTDRTPHESLPLPKGTRRQFFRLVTSKVDLWFAGDNTANPLGVEPDPQITCVVKGSKFEY